LIEVLDDVDSMAVPIDVSNAVNVDDSGPVNNVTVPETNDWGFFDVFAPLVGIVGNIVETFFDVAEIVGPILGAFLVTARHNAPNCHALLMRRHNVKVIRHNSAKGMGLSSQERALLEEFRKFKITRLGPVYEPNRPVPVPLSVVGGKDDHKDDTPTSPVYTTVHGDDVLVHRRNVSQWTDSTSSRERQAQQLRQALDRLTQSPVD
jgi:hypothetical protein